MLPSAKFQVLTRNGSNLECEGKCVDVTLMVQIVVFVETFYVLPIHEAEIFWV